MTIKAEFLESCIVCGDPVHAGEIRDLRPEIFTQLKGMRYVREVVAPAPVVVEAPVEQPQKEPAKKRKEK